MLPDFFLQEKASAEEESEKSDVNDDDEASDEVCNLLVALTFYYLFIALPK
jgi:hypothetical protein